jgi:hypothetical protein
VQGYDRVGLRMNKYSNQCIGMRSGDALYSAEEAGQAAARAGRKDLSSVIARKQRQITTAGLVPCTASKLVTECLTWGFMGVGYAAR